MLTRSTRMCLRLAILLCWLQTFHTVFAANITVLDTDPSIVYSPAESWSSSSNLCSTCLNPGNSVSFHEGINSALSPDPTAVSTSSSLVAGPSSTGTTTTPPPQSSPSSVVTSEASSTTQDGMGSHDPVDSPGDEISNRALTRQLLDDSGSPVTLSFNFTGTAIYLFCIQPPNAASVGGTPANTNLSFTLDNQVVGNFSPMETITEFLPNQNVLSLDSLSDQLHQLVVTVGDDSVFLFSSLIYTNRSAGNPTPHTTEHDKKNDVATFAGAIGGSVGALSLFCLGIAISIIRRRILAARRDRLDNEANPSGDTPPMFGPMPFVPRFFPDTVIPPDPPAYDDALSSTNHNSMPLLASQSSSEYSTRQRSYADIPPASPPPPLEELPPPPPFSLALAARIHDTPPADVTVPLIPAEDQTSGSPEVGSSSSNFTSSHEDTPLLQSPDLNTRPRSRISTRSLETPENSETELHQEDDS